MCDVALEQWCRIMVLTWVECGSGFDHHYLHMPLGFWLLASLFLSSLEEFSSDLPSSSVPSDATLSIHGDGVSTLPCGHADESPCISVTFAIKNYPDSVQFSLGTGSVTETRVLVTRLLI
jgi:hypothetical protein